MDNSIRTKWIFLALALVFPSGCKDKSDNLPSGAKERVVDVSNSEDAQDLTKLPHEPSDGILLTAEVLDEDNWIIGLTWENVGNVPLSLRMPGLLNEDVTNGVPGPFLPPAYSTSGNTSNRPRAIILDFGKHADALIRDLNRVEGSYSADLAYDALCEMWGSDASYIDSFVRKVSHVWLLPGDKRTCFFRFPRYKADDEAGRWKEGERIPVDFRYFVGLEADRDTRVSITSGADGTPQTKGAPQAWQGEVSSNVVYLQWKSGGERVRFPVSPLYPTAEPPKPHKGLLLSLEIVDEKKWVVRLTWKNVGKTPIELPVVQALEHDIKQRDQGMSPPYLFTPLYYTNYRHYGRPFGSRLVWGEQVDNRLSDLDRDRRHSHYAEAYEALLAIDGQGVDNHRLGGILRGTKWLHLEPDESIGVLFRFPRFESDDREKRWAEGEKIPLEFRFEAGEIPNSRPPEREERIGDEIRLKRYPAWQGDVFSNVVFFTWTSGSERVKWKEPVK